MLHDTDEATALRAPVRNRYFFGKLLDVRHMRMEQRYFNEKRWLLNRLTQGFGVLCGLEVEPTEDRTKLWIRPGVALDGLGREIVVTESFCVERPDQPTDACGVPEGEAVRDNEVTICLAYHECDIEPARSLGDGCDGRDACVPSAVRERFRVIVERGVPDEPETVLDRVRGATPAERRSVTHLFETAAGPASPVVGPTPGGPLAGPAATIVQVRQTLCALLRNPCEPADRVCVVLATAKVDGEGALSPEVCMFRRTVYSNAALLDGFALVGAELLRLVERLRRRRRLRYVAGDAQTALVGVNVGTLEVRLENDEGEPVDGEEVWFQIMGGGGELEEVAGGVRAPQKVVASHDGGLADVTWFMGPEPGLNTVEAFVTRGPARITFHADATVPERALRVGGGDAQSGTAAKELPTAIGALVVDGDGNPAGGDLVTFTVTGGGGTLATTAGGTGASQQDVTADAGGTAQVFWSIGPDAGLNTLAARLGADDAVLGFHALGVAPGLRLASGDAQSAGVGSALDAAIEVTVVDAHGKPLDGETVRFSVTGGGGALAAGRRGPGAVTQDVASHDGGRAEIGWTLGPSAGLNTAEATLASGARIAFHALATGRGN